MALTSEAQEHPGCRRVAVVVDDSADSAAALRRAASQARQRNATLDVICIITDDADAAASTMARVKLGEFTRRECPYGVGAPVCLRVERGEPAAVHRAVSVGAELLITVYQNPADTGSQPGGDEPGADGPGAGEPGLAAGSAQPSHSLKWMHAIIHATAS
jgi:universal stress protein family protein